jgi:hypothetical protein
MPLLKTKGILASDLANCEGPVSAGIHGNADVRFHESGCVIHSVSDHGDSPALGAQFPHAVPPFDRAVVPTRLRRLPVLWRWRRRFLFGLQSAGRFGAPNSSFQPQPRWGVRSFTPKGLVSETVSCRPRTLHSARRDEHEQRWRRERVDTFATAQIGHAYRLAIANPPPLSPRAPRALAGRGAAVPPCRSARARA